MCNECLAQLTQLTATEQLIRNEVIRLGGDWESGTKPQLVAFVGDRFDSEHFELLTHLPDLRWLAVTDCDIDCFGLSCISQLARLERIDLTRCRLDLKCFALLKRNRSLREIYLHSVEMDAISMAQLATLHHVEILMMTDLNVNEKMINELLKMKQLKKCMLVDSDGYSMPLEKQLLNGLPNLER